MWNLCYLACEHLRLDLQWVEESRKYNRDYFLVEIKPLVTDLAMIDLFGTQLNDTTGVLKMDLRELWDRWISLRNVLAKYLGPEHEGILTIDNKYYSGNWPSFLCPGLPEFTFHRRPSIPIVVLQGSTVRVQVQCRFLCRKSRRRILKRNHGDMHVQHMKPRSTLSMVRHVIDLFNFNSKSIP